MEPILEGAVEVHSFLGPGDERTLADDVLDGLTRPLKHPPPKHLDDARGSSRSSAGRSATSRRAAGDGSCARSRERLATTAGCCSAPTS